jgi:hypothetical protein
MPLNINVNDIEVSNDDFSPLPDGKYPARVYEAQEEQRTAKNGNEYEQVRLTFEICSGEYKGRRAWRNAIFTHPSAAACDIGVKFLSSLHTAQGNDGNITAEALGDSNTCVEIVLSTGEAKNGYAARQEVRFVNRLKNQPADCCGGDSACPAPEVDADDIF